MDDRLTQLRRWIICALAIGLVVWGSLGLYQGLNHGFTGGLYDPDYKVTGVFPGGLADRSGFKPGDRIISVDGVPVEQLGMESRWPGRLETAIGQSRRFIVERSGERIPVDVVYPAPSSRAANNRIGAALSALAFLLIGLWAFLFVDTAPARLLGYIGLFSGIAASCDLGPGLDSLKGVQSHVGTAASVLIWILIFRFFVIFPEPKRIRRSRLAWGLICGAWIGLIGFLVAELVVHPKLYYTTGSVAGPLMICYGVLILAAILHTFIKSPRAALSRSGMWLILGGFLLTLASEAATLFSGQSFPGWANALMVLPIPLSMALAVRKQAHSTPARGAGGSI